ncbi:MAG: chorismate mutase [Rickettsiales bacterium]|jgi:chorismate mutase
MANNSKQEPLLQLRSKIDEIDDKLINLLGQRIELVKEVGEYKKSINESFFVKSAREADMIKNLLLKANKSIPKSTIVNIWRKLIASANALEQDLKIAIFNPSNIADYQYLVREYYGDFIAFTQGADSSQILSDIENNHAQIAVFAVENDSINQNIWWQYLAKNHCKIKIFARIPFIGSSPYQLFVAAIKAPEKSQNDQTLAVVSDFDAAQLTSNKSALKCRIMQSKAGFSLIEIDGFFQEGDEKIAILNAKIIGHFAHPISLDEIG